MPCAVKPPALWAPQPRLAVPVMRFLALRLEAALAYPGDRALLVWPTVLGAPIQRETHPEGIPQDALLSQAAGMLAALGLSRGEQAWIDTLERYPDTADRGKTGWVPHRIWEPQSAAVSLRTGVTLLALMGQPEDDRYALHSGVQLFNCALFHECHSALETLWQEAEGDLKRGLQGLVYLTAGYFHQQTGNRAGMANLWQEALEALEPFNGRLPTPWGLLHFEEALEATSERMQNLAEDGAPEELWTLPRPEWELT